MYDILELNKKLLPELKEIAKQLNVKKADVLRKQDLIYKILDEQAIMATETKKSDKKPEGGSFNADHKRRGRSRCNLRNPIRNPAGNNISVLSLKRNRYRKSQPNLTALLPARVCLRLCLTAMVFCVRQIIIT